MNLLFWKKAATNQDLEHSHNPSVKVVKTLTGTIPVSSPTDLDMLHDQTVVDGNTLIEPGTVAHTKFVTKLFLQQQYPGLTDTQADYHLNRIEQGIPTDEGIAKQAQIAKAKAIQANMSARETMDSNESTVVTAKAV